MSRISKKKKRIKQGIRIARRNERRSDVDHMAMLAANVDSTTWGKMAEYHRQLYRLRAQQAMSIFTEPSDVRSE